VVLDFRNARKHRGSAMLARALTAVLVLLAWGQSAKSADAGQHGIAMHGTPALSANFAHFPYVNPDAVKGGRIVLGQVGSFDNLNPFIVRGVTPASIRGFVYESLLARSADEPFSLYGLIAKTVEMPDDRSSVTFHLNPDARFSDGKPVTTADVAFTLELLRSKGRPFMRSHYSKVAQVDVVSEVTIKFTFGLQGDREIPLIMGLMPILPKHAIDPETFTQTSLQFPVGSGPYKMTNVDPGRAVTYQRNPSYWGAELPSRVGLYNFDTIRYDFFRSTTALFEAFKSGKLDYRVEADPARWIDSYDFPAVKSGQITKHTFKSGLPAGMAGFVFNTRRKVFADQRVRQAFQLAFDARRVNSQMFHDRYARSTSFFSRSALASTGKAASPKERTLLASFDGAVKSSVLDGTWRPPEATDRKARRKQLREAFGLLKQAGYKLSGRNLVNEKTGAPFAVEFLVTTSEQERLALAFATDLKKLGIKPTIRQMESSQYWARLGTFDFDIIQWRYRASLSPGNEQIHRWSSKYADVQRSFNYPGVKSPAADAMIEHMLKAVSREDFEAAVRAFDRVLLSGDFVVPLFHDPKQWIAANSKLSFPKRTPLFGVDLNTWWLTK
ncbi:MAG: extracellular solute-binding protein, partial [Pseudomonadota bacterium]